MNRELVFIVYASDIDASVAFYSDLLGLETDFVTPRYVTFALGEGVFLALWSGNADSLEGAANRTSEVCLNVPADEVTTTFEQWKNKGVTILREPYEEVFGTTFVIEDPDGNLIRVAPIDQARRQRLGPVTESLFYLKEVSRRLKTMRTQ